MGAEVSPLPPLRTGVATGRGGPPIAACSLVCAVVAAAVFSPAIGFDFVRWDDDISVTQNRLVTETWSRETWSGIWSGEHAMRFQPLRWMLFRAVHAVAGLEPAAWHALGVVLHALAAALAPIVFAAWYRRFAPEAPERLVNGVALACGLLWAVHPLRVEPVAWVTASSYPLATVFMLISAWAHARAWSGDGGRPSRRWITLCWLSASAAVLSYPTALGFPFFLLAMEAGPLARAPRAWWKPDRVEVWRWWGRQVLFAVPSLVALGVTLFARFATPGIFGEAPGLAQSGVLERVFAALASAAWFPFRIVLPLELNANLSPMRNVEGWEPLVWFLAIASMVFGVWAWCRWRAAPGVLWTIVAYLALAAPCLGLTERPVWPVDRYSYLLDLFSIGVAGAVVLRAWPCLNRPLRQAVGVAAALAVGGSALMAGRILPHWRDTDALFQRFERMSNFSRSPVQKAHVYRLWAYHHGAGGDEASAQRLLSQALAVYRDAMSESVARGDYLTAIRLAYTRESVFGPDAILTRERGVWWWRLGRGAEARRDLLAALREMPNDERALAMLDEITAAGRRPDSAMHRE